MTRKLAMMTPQKIPVNGIDVSHWNGKPPSTQPDWCEFYGMKATHVGGSKMVNGVDPLFRENREAAANVRWRGLYAYLVGNVPLKEQILLLVDAVGELAPGECVELDWEENSLIALDEEAMYYLDLFYKDRWIMYINDMTPSMIEWMQANVDAKSPIPIHHPNWNIKTGLAEARRWEAAIWQVGTAVVPGWANPIDVNLVLEPEEMDRVTGR